MPVCIVQNIAQPHRKATDGESDSDRKTYTPPAFGNADDSSAAISAPKRVSSPATIHTVYTAPSDGTDAVIADGCTKIDAPMMIPTTSAVAWMRPRERLSIGKLASRLASDRASQGAPRTPASCTP